MKGEKNDILNDVKKFNELLKTFRSTNDSFHSHVSMGVPRGVFSFGKHMPEFWNLYQSVYETEQQYLAENPGEDTPILVDVDLKILYEENNVVSLYSNDQIETIIKAYQSTIIEFISFFGSDQKKQDSALTCVLLEKESYVAEIGGTRFIKNGFHLHFPKIFLNRKVHESYIIPKVKILTKGLFSNIGIEDFIDSNSLNVHWLLYGSSKYGNKPYKATKCYLKNCVETTFEDGLGDYIVSCHKGENKDDLLCQNRVMKMLPRILSIFLYDRVDEYFYDLSVSACSPLINDIKRFKKINKFEEISVKKTLEEAEILLGMINSSRSDDRNTWLNIGFCLWNLCQGCYEGFILWCEFAEKSCKFNECESITYWKKMRENQFTLGTLIYYAKIDSPEKYADFIKERTKKLFCSAISGGHNDLAHILFNEFQNEFVCTSIKTKDWFQFKNHIWTLTESGTSLRERISNNNSAIISFLRSNNEDEDDETDEEIRKKNKEKKNKLINKLINSCKSAPFKNNVMTEAQELFYNEKFLRLLNKNPNLIAFKNGVYDFENDLFRDGVPEDFISSSLPIEYHDYKNHPLIDEVEDFFEKVFPDKDIRDYFFDQVSQVFVGGNRAKVILFWTGEGNNGKTVTQNLFEKMLGSMAIKFSTSLITGKKKDLGSAAPELARAGDGVRWAVMDEPNADEMISSGTLKSLTGNDSFFARDLFQKGKETFEITPMFKLHMICNKLPIIKDADNATWNRVRVIPFEATFLPVEECPKDITEQFAQKKFPVDKHFSVNKIPKLSEPLAWYLIQRWRLSRNTECVEPDKVKVATSLYRQENDIYKHFEQQCIIDKPGTKITIAVLYSYFKDWFKEEYPQFQIPPRTTFRTHFVGMWGNLIKNRFWLNKTIGTGEGEIDEDDDIVPVVPSVSVPSVSVPSVSVPSVSVPSVSVPSVSVLGEKNSIKKKVLCNKKINDLNDIHLTNTLDPDLIINHLEERREAMSTILLRKELQKEIKKETQKEIKKETQKEIKKEKFNYVFYSSSDESSDEE
jgi:P4 family phage/plasmid primase-like protien